MDAKTSCRRVTSQARAARPATDRDAAGRALAAAAVRHWSDAASVCAYASVDGEPPTSPLIAELTTRGVRVLLPVVDGKALDWAEYAGPDYLTLSTYGLLEPTSPRLGPAAVAGVDVVLVPALSVDRRGTRLGRGGGYYDRALAALATAAERPALVAVVYDDELVDTLPAEPHDVRMDAALTPGGLVSLNGSDRTPS
jgi:5-formyltetrahydrofolate cyclo-ligase